MADESVKRPKVFISYAWEDDTKEWVRSLAERLRYNGVETALDEWEVAPGDSLPEFMEKSVSISDYVLVICTPTYKKKSESDSPSGVVYEKGVIVGELFVKRNQRKFIPILKKGKWIEAAPEWALHKKYIDLSDNPYLEKNYRELLMTLYGKREIAPPLGPPPDFSGPSGNSSEPKPLRKPLISKYAVDEFIASLKNFTGKLIPLLRVVGILIVVGVILWVSTWAIPKLIPLIPIPKATSTQPLVTQVTFASSPVLPSKTTRPNPTPTKTQTPVPTPVPVIFNPHPDSSDFFDTYGVPMRLVKSGSFTMGSTTNESDEQPVHQVNLSAFYIDKYEITNILYDACVKDGKCQKPQNISSQTRFNYYDNSVYSYFPVVYVDWTMARTYCEWRGARLPTEAEWEKSARGTDGRTYPWGNDIDCRKANYLGCTGDTTKIGSYESGKSVYGVYDLAYNVWEWTSSIYRNYPYNANDGREDLSSSEPRMLRGSSWNGGPMVNIFADRFGFWQDSVSSDFGFRCALTP